MFKVTAVSLVPLIKHSLRKYIFIYFPVGLILLNFPGEKLGLCIFLIFILLIEVLDYVLDLEGIEVWLLKIQKMLLSKTSFVILFLGTEFCILFKLPTLNFLHTQTHIDFLIGFFGAYISVLGVGLSLIYGNASRALDKYNYLAYRMFLTSWKSLDAILVCVVILVSAVLPFQYSYLPSLIDKNVILSSLSIAEYLILGHVLIGLISLAFVFNRFTYASTPKGIAELIEKSLIHLIKNASPNLKPYFDHTKKSRLDIFRRYIYRSPLFQKLFLKITGEYVSLHVGFGGYKNQDIDKLKDQITDIFRLLQKALFSSNNEDFKSLSTCIINIFRAYILYSNNYNTTDDLSTFILIEYKTLFDLALKKDENPEVIDYIVRDIERIALIISHYNGEWGFENIQTHVWEQALIDFLIKSLPKGNSNATISAKRALYNIGISYLTQNKETNLLHSIKNILETADILSVSPDDWVKKITFRLAVSANSLYFRFILDRLLHNKKGTNFYQYDFKKFIEDLAKIILTYYSIPSKTSITSEMGFIIENYTYSFADLGDAERSNMPLNFFLTFLEQETGKHEIASKTQADILEICVTLVNHLINPLFTLRKNKNFIDEMSSSLQKSCFLIVSILFNFYHENKFYKKIPNDLLANFITKSLSVEDGFLDPDRFDGGESSRVFILTKIIAFAYVHKDSEHLLKVIKESLVGEMSKLNDSNDERGHVRGKLYANMIFFGAIISKLFPGSKHEKDFDEMCISYMHLKKWQDMQNLPIGEREDSTSPLNLGHYPIFQGLNRHKIWDTKTDFLSRRTDIKFNMGDALKYITHLNDQGKK